MMKHSFKKNLLKFSKKSESIAFEPWLNPLTPLSSSNCIVPLYKNFNLGTIL